MKLRQLGIGFLASMAFLSAQGAEIDQFSVKDQKVDDSRAYINAKINEYVELTLEQLHADNVKCNDKKLYKGLRKYLHNHVFGEITDYIENDKAIEKIFLTPNESIYREWTMWDGFVLGRPGAEKSKLAMSPLININNTYIGVDKIEHLFERGFAYFEDHYLNGDEIEDVLLTGVYTEKVIFGGKKWGTGVFSYADLAANFNGLRFWNNILGKNRDLLAEDIGPYIKCVDSKWKQVKQIDIAHYIDDAQDESINCSTYASEGSTKKIKKALKDLNIKSCPIAPEKFQSLKKKYGYYGSFILNSDGVGLAKSMDQWRADHDRQDGWVKVPKKFKPLLEENYNNLEYYAPNKYLRTFRSEVHGRHGKSSTNKDYRHHSFKTIKFDRDYHDKQLLQCWYIFMTGGDCEKVINAPLPTAYTSKGTLDLLAYTRQISKQSGLVRALNYIKNVLENKNEDSKILKEKIIQTTLNKELSFSDSFYTIDPSERKKIGVFLVLGIGGDDSDNAILIRKASEEIRNLGFTSSMLEVDPNKGSNYNSSMLREILKHKIPKLDKVVFVSASKGTADFIRYFLRFGHVLPENERAKVRLMVSLSGVVRSSFVAKYITEANYLTALAVRTGLRLTGKSDMLDGIESLANDPWEGYDITKIHREFPNMKWMSFPSLPESELAVTNLSLWSGFLRQPVHRWTHIASPGDGLVETAAAILPPDTGITEYIIPITGPHAMALGSYREGVRLAPEAQGNRYDKVNPEAGPEILSALFRALPKSLLD
ncbi:hypothetical protein M899_2347 [Bacteriovorax sp. BSW11_IV]|uniref:hypothetical protein n=1 Tax=Bacteriovorax sp. BSW11_IV TaxID=1353529 RepID=UPI00038A28F5|nr:hypothetical protein [Bacteriovorax sp. BSW11_IV]EQC44481.1 hypothetical protein M899_2347 [Bacteriovorax sp. BSW11_IV]